MAVAGWSRGPVDWNKSSFAAELAVIIITVFHSTRSCGLLVTRRNIRRPRATARPAATQRAALFMQTGTGLNISRPRYYSR